MGSSLTALVAPAGAAFESEAAQRGLRVVTLPQAMALVPLVGEWCADWTVAEMRFTNLAATVLEWVRTTSVRTSIAYVENETFAGEGMQGAAIWRDHEVVWGPHFTCDIEVDADDPYVWAPELTESAVNRALRELGVERGGQVDEYAALGLHMRRNTADWLAPAS